MEDSEKRRRFKPERNKEGRQRLGGNERETAKKNDIPNEKMSVNADETRITSQRELITQQKKCRQQPYTCKQLACEANMLLGGTGHSHSLLKMN